MRTSTSGLSGAAELARLAAQGVELCRNGEWERGMSYLNRAANHPDSGQQELPGAFYSYLGLAVIRLERRYREGVRLCERGVQLDFYQPECYYNLSRAYLAANDVGSAYKAATKGYKLDPNHRGLKQLLAQEFAKRRPPVLPFLKRSNPLNVMLGKMRHQVREGPKAGQQAAEELYEL
jgi:tetratricopeptide (TPR) repeat protein